MRRLLVGSLTLALAAATAQASTVLVDTTANGGWTVSRTVANSDGSYQDPTTPVAATVFNANLWPVNNGNGPWVSPVTVNGQAQSQDSTSHDAAWIAPSSNGYVPGETNGTYYTYTDTINLGGTTGTDVTLTGAVSSDNWIIWGGDHAPNIPGINGSTTLISGASVAILDGSNQIVAYQKIDPTSGPEVQGAYAFAVNVSVYGLYYTPPAKLVLTFNVVDSYQSGDFGTTNPDNPSPTGFIMAGSLSGTNVEAAPVPLPAAAWLGFSMLGGMGLISKLRKRKNVAI